MGDASVFRVRLYGFRGRDLPAKDRNGLSDPYLHCNFDNFKTFKTPTIKKTLNPDWRSFSLEFFYETRYVHKLDKKAFKIQCFDYDRIGSDDFMGGATITLHTLATGPVRQELLLRDGGKPKGYVDFFCEMEMYSEVSVLFKSIEVIDLVPTEKSGVCHPYCQYFFSATKKAKKENLSAEEAEADLSRRNNESPFVQHASYKPQVYKTDAKMATRKASWSDGEIMYFKATLREMMRESIVLRVNHDKKLKRDPVLGECLLSLPKYAHPRRSNVPTRFAERLFNTSGEPAGFIEGIVVFKDLPFLAQMIGGINKELGVVGGKPILEGMETPKTLVHEVFDPTKVSKETMTASDDKIAKAGSRVVPGTSECPVCHLAFPKEVLSVHINRCLEKTTGVTDSPTASTTFTDSPTASSAGSTPSIQVSGSEKLYDVGQLYDDEYDLPTTHLDVRAAPPVSPMPSPRRERSDRQHVSPRSPRKSSPRQSPRHSPRRSPKHSPRKSKEEDEVPLPEDWEKRVTSKGRPYWVCHSTRSTQWTAPTREQIEKARKVPNYRSRGSASAQSSGTKELPHGWEECKDALSGRVYYINHNDKTTHWTIPQ